MNPDVWCILKLPDELYKVFGMNRGGYTTGESWKLNSGIVRVEEEGEHLLFHGVSGSVYRCRKDAYGTTGYGGTVVADLIIKAESSGAEVVVMPGSTDWLAIDY